MHERKSHSTTTRDHFTSSNKIFPFFCIILVLSLLFYVHYSYDFDHYIYGTHEKFSVTGNSTHHDHKRLHIFPRLTHQMWKTKDSIPTDCLRWHTNCKKLNPDYSFLLYDDTELKNFVHEKYPEYTPLFDALKGVYMADMARVIIAYHYGGIYMDLDFYCHRRFSCLEQYVLYQITSLLPSTHQGYSFDSYDLSNHPHMLAVSREPDLHTFYIHNQSRVVIQDFFMVTPKHPFLQWMLDTKTAEFQGAGNTLVNKGPFSYSIQEHLNEYYTSKKMEVREKSDGIASIAYRIHPRVTPTDAPSTRPTVRPTVALTTSEVKVVNTTVSKPAATSTSAGTTTTTVGTNTTTSSTHRRHLLHDTPSSVLAATNTSSFASGPNGKTRLVDEFILEMEASVLHPLIDASNSRITKGCTNHPITPAGVDTPRAKGLDYQCERFANGKYLAASTDTMLSHMWTHTYLGWSFLRGWYDHNTYVYVENQLKPSNDCPAYYH